MKIRRRKYCSLSYEPMLLEAIKQNNAMAYIKRGTFSTEVVWGGKAFLFPSKNKKDYSTFKSGLFMFNKVRSDAMAFLNANPKFKLPKRERSIVYSNDIPKNILRKVCATDLNHAYWRLALNLGVITNATYRKGLPTKLKSIRLAALSTLGAGRTYLLINDGVQTKESVTFGVDEGLKDVYKLIRYTCYKHMTKLAKMLGGDFLAYKTDCIYYYDTPTNRAIVNKYFQANDLLFKQLS